MEKIIYITEEIAKNLPANTLSTLERDTDDTVPVPGESIVWLTDTQITELETKLGYRFNNKTLLTQAFTHSSCRTSQNSTDKMDNEALEFIGDRSIDLLITKKLINRYGKTLYNETESKNNVNDFNPLYMEKNEGELTQLKTQLVNTTAFSNQATKLGLHNYIITGSSDINGEIKNQDSVRENLFEAVIGAVTVDCSWDMSTVESVLDRIYNVEALIEGDIDDTNYIGLLQEYMQKNYGVLPFYKYIDLTDYDEVNFMCELRIPRYTLPDKLPEAIDQDDEYAVIAASGITKQEARWWAAKTAYKAIENTENNLSLIKSSVGEPTPDRAVNQLQELWQKNLIDCPEYTFAPNSNFPEVAWECTCYIANKGSYTVLAADKKTAKKHSAYFALCSMCGTKLDNSVPDTNDALEYKHTIEELRAELCDTKCKIALIRHERDVLYSQFETLTDREATPETTTQIEEIEIRLAYSESQLCTLIKKHDEIVGAIEDINRSFGIHVENEEIDPRIDTEIEDVLPPEAIEAVGEPNLDRAVNQLQELWQKDYIDQPTYEASETVTDVSLWTVTCRIEDTAETTASAPSKQAAKKQAAYNMYCLLLVGV